MTQNILEIDGVSKIYKGGKKALDGVSFNVESGDFYTLLGPNGAGKTTLIGMMSSLVNITSGHIRIGEYDIQKQPDQAKALIGVVPQEMNLNTFEQSRLVLLHQAAYFGIRSAEAKIRANALLDLLQLGDKANTPVRFLSGGMKRRLMIARALMHRPQLLLLDEPTTGVDVEIREIMWQAINRFNQEEGMSIILTTHYLEEAESLAKKVAIIDQGKLVADTSVESLLHVLAKERVILYVKDPLDINVLPKGYEYSIEDTLTLAVDLEKSQSLTSLLKDLSQAGIEVLRMRNHKNRLEQVFVKMVAEHQ